MDRCEPEVVIFQGSVVCTDLPSLCRVTSPAHPGSDTGSPVIFGLEEPDTDQIFRKSLQGVSCRQWLEYHVICAVVQAIGAFVPEVVFL